MVFFLHALVLYLQKPLCLVTVEWDFWIEGLQCMIFHLENNNWKRLGVLMIFRWWCSCTDKILEPEFKKG